MQTNRSINKHKKSGLVPVIHYEDLLVLVPQGRRGGVTNSVLLINTSCFDLAESQLLSHILSRAFAFRGSHVAEGDRVLCSNTLFNRRLKSLGGAAALVFAGCFTFTFSH